LVESRGAIQLLLLIHGSCFKSSMYGRSLYLCLRQRPMKFRHASEILSSPAKTGVSPSLSAFCRPNKSWWRMPHGFPPTSISTAKQPMLHTSLRLPYLQFIASGAIHASDPFNTVLNDANERLFSRMRELPRSHNFTVFPSLPNSTLEPLMSPWMMSFSWR